MNWYKQSQENRIVAYHGTSGDFEIFDTAFSGQGTDQEGPGIYFSSNPDDASAYADGQGAKVFPVYLNFKKTVPLEGNVNQEEIKYLILKSLNLNSEDDLYNMDEDVFYNSLLSNWAENPTDAFYQLFSSIVSNAKSPHDAFQTAWYELYRDNPNDYLRLMTGLGYDGVIVPKQGDAIHYIVFNSNIIQPMYSKET